MNAIQFQCDRCKKIFKTDVLFNKHENKKKPCKKIKIVNVLESEETTPQQNISVENSEMNNEDLYYITGENVKRKGNIISIMGDCFSELDRVADKSIQTVCIDPPYNIGKDTWDKIDNYIEWLTSVVVKLQSKMKDNGSMFIFHNDMEQIAELMISIKSNSKLVFKQMIVWNKRFENSSKKGFLDGFIVKNVLHNWNKMAEYILYYTFDNTWKLAQARKEKNVAQMTISREILSKTGGLTGWYSNLETGKNLPTHETIVPITKHLGITFDDLVPKYKNLKKDHSVWNYDMAKRCDIHVTPKPSDLLKNILLHTTDPGDIVLDCFAGSGSIAEACLKTNRKCIMIEREKKYYDYIAETYGLS
jgi:site-specific DNA-methyltransferase (adenine-specific)